METKMISKSLSMVNRCLKEPHLTTAERKLFEDFRQKLIRFLPLIEFMEVLAPEHIEFATMDRKVGYYAQ